MSLEDRDKTVLEMLRHYGGMRFLMLPLFFTSMGAVVVAYWTVISADGAFVVLHRWVALAGLLLSVFFAVYEYRLSVLLFNVSSLLPDSMAQLKHKSRFGAVTVITLALYGVPSIFWSWCLFTAFYPATN